MKWSFVLACACLCPAAIAASDPLRLRGDALATTSSPAGLVVVQAAATPHAGISAEAVVWMATQRTPGEDQTGDVLVLVVRGATAKHRATGQLGRFVMTLGAIRPVQIDGGAARVRLPGQLDLEATAGIPVAPLGAGRAWDWLVGTRVARRFGFGGSVGLAYAQQRDDGTRVFEEVGADAGFELSKRADVGARAAYDVLSSGLAELRLSAAYRRAAIRVELYGGYRASSHLVPATSLFSVLGDISAQRAGSVVTWRAAPRLDVIAEVGGVRIGDEVAPELVARTRLRLDDRGTSMLGAELRRSGIGIDGWTGVRGLARLALPHALVLGSELELVRPDRDSGRGVIWPWALVSLGAHRGAWDAALAVEASATPESRGRIDVLAQLGRRWGMP